MTPAIEVMFSASRKALVKSIIVCVAPGTISIMSLKKSSTTGARVALMAVDALPKLFFSKSKLVATPWSFSAWPAVICSVPLTASNLVFKTFNSLELSAKRGFSLDKSLPKDSRTKVT